MGYGPGGVEGLWMLSVHFPRSWTAAFYITSQVTRSAPVPGPARYIQYTCTESTCTSQGIFPVVVPLNISSLSSLLWLFCPPHHISLFLLPLQPHGTREGPGGGNCSGKSAVDSAKSIHLCQTCISARLNHRVSVTDSLRTPLTSVGTHD